MIYIVFSDNIQIIPLHIRVSTIIIAVMTKVDVVKSSRKSSAKWFVFFKIYSLTIFYLKNYVCDMNIKMNIMTICINFIVNIYNNNNNN